MQPDITYDIDGDGVVSQKDYFIAQKFDFNQDGILDSQEKQVCLNALKNGYENNFIFGLDKQLASINRTVKQSELMKHRVFQKNGKIV